MIWSCLSLKKICLWSYLDCFSSVPGLILNPEPYYNEAGYEKQKGSQQGLENSRLYNEMAILKLVQVTVHVGDTRRLLVF